MSDFWAPPAPPPRPMSSRIQLLPIFVGHADRAVDPTLTFQTIVDFVDANLRPWLTKLTYGHCSVDVLSPIGTILLPNPIGRFDRDRYLELFVSDIITNMTDAQFTRWSRLRTNAVTLVFNAAARTGAAVRTPTVHTPRGDFTVNVLSYGVDPPGTPRGASGAGQFLTGLFEHEFCHAALGVGMDRYGFRVPVHGDVIVAAAQDEKGTGFRIVKVDGSRGKEIRHFDLIALEAENSRYVVAEGGGDDVVNANRDRIGDWEKFKVVNISRPKDVIAHGDDIALQSANHKWLVAEPDGVLHANRTYVTSWETFRLISDNPSTRVIRSRAPVRLRGTHGWWWVARPDSQSTGDDRARGWSEEGVNGFGCAGDFDIMDAADSVLMLGAYDRIQRGWIAPRVVRPGDRQWHTLRPSVDFPDALVLFDPEYPHEWYVLENRRKVLGLDEVPSSGLAVFWIDQRLPVHRYPTLISAALRSQKPNFMSNEPTFFPVQTFKRRQTNSLFYGRSTAVLPKGDGSQSRFQITYETSPAHSDVRVWLA